MTLFTEQHIPFLRKIGNENNLYVSIKVADDRGKLNLEDKKRCCLLANGFTLDSFTTKARWKNIETDKIESKYQWFHSAVAIYMLLTGFVKKPEQSCIDPILISKTETTFVKIAQEVILSDPSGLKVIETISNKVPSLIVDDHNGTVTASVLND